MKILFLDDDPYRTKHFKSKKPFAVCVATAKGCIEELQKDDWDYVFLDHDLGGETFVDSDQEETGMEVVRWIQENKPNIKKVIVHSLNYPAATNMLSKITDLEYNAVYVPFVSLLNQLEEVMNND